MIEERRHKEPLTIEEIRDNCKHSPDGGRVCFINQEVTQGIDFIEKYPNSITFFGSARFDEDNQYYKEARKVAGMLSEDGFTIVTGGGPGIMEAANRGAKEAGGKSIGLFIRLPTEQHGNVYTTDHIEFYYFFNRKVALAFSAKAFLFFPGGFGTMDEIFEILTLVQTNKIKKVPIVFFGKEFWEPLIENVMKGRFLKEGTIDEEDLSLFTITDSAEEAVENINKLIEKNEE